MPHISDCFNKKSRYIKSAGLTETAAVKLRENTASQMAERLSALLQIQNDFFPCFDWAFPPPLLSKSSAPDSIEDLFSVSSVTPGRYSIYLHSPFCKSLCSFCYYAVIPGDSDRMAEDYIDHLVKEMAMYSPVMEGMTCESVYFGGGTPTFLQNDLLVKVFSSLQRYFLLAADAEITIEASPGTLPEEKLWLLRELGVNRLSYGIQSLDERLLKGMNRDYSLAEARVELSSAVNLLGNVNVDTMYGFAGEHQDDLLNTLSELYELGVPSVSIYALDQQRSQTLQNFAPPKDELYQHKIEQFARAEAFLGTKGFRPVLQNVFADPERASYRHQVRRWDNLPLLGLGINAQGYAPQRPYQNISGIKSYCQQLAEGRLPVATVDKLDRELEVCREITSKLRFTYMSTEQIKFKYGLDVRKVFRDLIDSLEGMGFLTCQDDILCMTPAAAYYNNILPMLFSPDAFKERLSGLPEEYIATFPVPRILTGIGKTQSAAFEFGEAGGERRVSPERRKFLHAHNVVRRNNPERRETAGRRSVDRMGAWSVAAAG